MKGVLDENKRPLIGATIQVKGENNGVAADLDGNFTLKVKKNATLVVSYIGYDAGSPPARKNTDNSTTNS